MGISFSAISKKYGMSVQTCFEDENLVSYGFKNDVCLSHTRAFKLTGKAFKNWKARKCGCVQMVDIGTYNSCKHLCKYCYANYDEKMVENNVRKHDVNSSLLIGKLEENDVIKVRKG